MFFLAPSAAKLNLSLRVTSLREDGYHDIVSLFLRLPPLETLLISVRSCGKREDRVLMRGAGTETEIPEENIVIRALRNARAAGVKVPFTDVEITKTYFPGSGLGAGSGNAAALLRWLAGDEANMPLWWNIARKTGADVPFLFSGIPLALVWGIGEKIQSLPPLSVDAWVVFPDWSVGTENAYDTLDRYFGAAYPMNEDGARNEAKTLLRRLRDKERVGLLPNDFAPQLMEKFPDYDKLFKLFDSAGSCAWGITGSGGAAFALFPHPSPRQSSIPWPERVKQVISIRTAEC